MGRTLTRRAAIVALGLGVVGAMSGCNVGALSYFLTPEQPLPARMKHLASKDSKVEPKVAILTYTKAGDIPADFIHADRQLAELLGKYITDFAAGQQEKISILPARRVEEFKNANPDWKQIDLAVIGRRLGVDHVIYLELDSLGMYEKGSGNSLFRGRAAMLVELADANRPDEPKPNEVYSCTFPSDARGPQPVGLDTQPMQFRMAFLSHMARQLAWKFCNHPRGEQRLMEPVF